MTNVESLEYLREMVRRLENGEWELQAFQTTISEFAGQMTLSVTILPASEAAKRVAYVNSKRDKMTGPPVGMVVSPATPANYLLPCPATGRPCARLDCDPPGDCATSAMASAANMVAEGVVGDVVSPTTNSPPDAAFRQRIARRAKQIREQELMVNPFTVHPFAFTKEKPEPEKPKLPAGASAPREIDL